MDYPSTPSPPNHSHLPSPSAPPPDRSIEAVEASPALALREKKRILTAREIIADPILSALAKKQNRLNTSDEIPSIPLFKAKPAPRVSDFAGPRMTKAAALRQGLPWEDKARSSTANATVQSQDAPLKRESSTIKSLAAPSMAPRPTKSSQLRTGTMPPPPVPKRDPQAVAAASRAKADEEKVKRRASIAVPSSLSAPTIAPRGNRSSILRAGGMPPTRTSALTTTTAANVPNRTDEASKLARRVSVAGTVKALNAPSIQPRLNKAAMLRNPGTARPATADPSVPRSTTTPTPLRPVQSIKSSSSVAPAGPKQTRSSMLRANLGAKVQK